MRTATEVGRDGTTPRRVFHMAGTNGRYQWTHAPDPATRARCQACQSGTIPADVLSGKHRST